MRHIRTLAELTKQTFKPLCRPVDRLRCCIRSAGPSCALVRPSESGEEPSRLETTAGPRCEALAPYQRGRWTTPSISRTSRLMAADSRRDPTQPSLFEKNKNIAAQRHLRPIVPKTASRQQPTFEQWRGAGNHGPLEPTLPSQMSSARSRLEIGRRCARRASSRTPRLHTAVVAVVQLNA